MTDLAKYVVSLEAETRKYRKGLDAANKKLTKFNRQQSRSLKNIEARFASFGRSAASSFTFLAGAGLTAALKNTARQAQELDNLSIRLGVNARALQAWQLIAERFNVTQQSLNTGIQRLTRRAAEAAEGVGEARGALRELGINARSFTRIGLDEQIFTLAEAFSKVDNEADQVRLAFKLFDTEGVGFLQFLKEGQGGLRGLRNELDGQLWSDTERAKLAELNKDLIRLEQALKLGVGGALATVAANTAEFFKSLQDGLVTITRRLQALAGNQVAADKLLRDQGLGTRTFGRPTPEPEPITIDRGQGGPAPDTEKRRFNAVAIDQSIARFKAFEEEVETARRKRQAGANFAIEQAIELGSKLSEAAAEAEENFNTLFLQNLVQAAEGGFKGVLQAWGRTLQQMAAKALSSALFRLLGFGNPDGGFLGIGKLLNFGGGGTVPGPIGAPRLAVVHGGEVISQPGGGGTPVNVTQNITVNGASRGEMLVAAKAIEENTRAVVFDELHRVGVV